MKTKIVALLGLGLMGLTASAEVMYWQVNNENSTVSGSGYDSAYLVATDGTTKYYVTQNTASDGSTPLGAAVYKNTFDNGGYAMGDLSSLNPALGAGTTLSSLSFFLELYDANNQWVAETAPMTYNDLSDAISSGFNPEFTGVNNALGGSGTTYTNVPEPTSGLLMLVGLGALALRRRKIA